jgi:hypothetical protein
VVGRLPKETQMRRTPPALGCMLALAMPAAAQDFDQILAANPTEGYAQPGPGTERRIRTAVGDLSR